MRQVKVFERRGGGYVLAVEVNGSAKNYSFSEESIYDDYFGAFVTAIELAVLGDLSPSLVPLSDGEEEGFVFLGEVSTDDLASARSVGGGANHA